MSLPGVWPHVLDYFGTPLVIQPSRGQLSGDAGLLPARQFDERIGLTRAFPDALDDPRDPDLTEHSFLEMVRSRVYGILAGDSPRSRRWARYARAYKRALFRSVLTGTPARLAASRRDSPAAPRSVCK
jgi:hypothetical protein